MEVIAIILLIITVFQIYVLAQKLNVLKFEKGVAIVGFLFLTISFIFEMYVLSMIYNEVTSPKINAFMSVYVVITLIINVVIYFWGKTQKRITRNSIKQAIDLSGTGILLLDRDDEIIMINSLMEEILKAIGVKKNFMENIKKHSVGMLGTDYLVKFKSKIYLFILNEDSGEILAEDITDEYNLQKAIDNQNKEIEKNNEKIIEMIEKIEKVEKEKELQKLKSTFHDLLGYKLSILHQYLIQNGKSTMSFDDIKWMLEDTLRNIENENVSKRNLEEMINVYKNIGVNIIISGELPKDNKKAKVFIEIIREAVTNAIKHANSSKICVNVSKLGEKDLMVITNDGMLPKKKIIENDGIKGMRKRLEEVNGSLNINTQKKFTIEVMS